ncbi:22084_t:CDS:1 [Cetraspora pellucida]|uniref:22084_t:CDS:1 n=1 Tax=Cetraspora pellucida TaxID=1433469 RepID=A0A9N9HTD8_9GLOM|nr:22084_t:CDS:1 [Cetraspora pellucida]
MSVKLIHRLMKTIKELDKNNSSRLQKYLKIHHDMKEFGMYIDQTERNYLIEAYLNVGELDKARKIFDEINELKAPLGKRICPYCPAFNMMIQAYGKLTLTFEDNLNEVTFLYSLMHEKHVMPNILTKNILSGIFQTCLNHGAIPWFNELMDKELVDSGLTKEVIAILLKNQKLDEALQIFKKMRTINLIPNIYTYNALIHALGKQERVDEALNVIRDMELQQLERDTVSYNVLIKIYSLLKNYEKMHQLVDDMLKIGIAPDVRTFGQLINVYAKLGKVNSALALLHKMVKLGIRPDRHIYTSLIELFANVNDNDSMEKVFHNMITDGIRPQEIAYYMLTAGYCNADNVYKAFRICRIMLEAGIEPTVRIYNALISLFAERGDSSSAYLLFNEMRTYGLTPDVYTYNSLIHANVKSGDLRKAEDTLMHMEFAGIEPQTTTYNILLHAYVERKDMDRAREIYNEMLESLIHPDNYTFCCLIDGFRAEGDLETAISLFNHMEHNYSLNPDAHIYTVLIHGHLQKGDFVSAKKFYETMVLRGIKPTYVTFAVLIDGHARHGDLEFARKLVSKLVSQPSLALGDQETQEDFFQEKATIPAQVFTPLMDAYSKQGNVDAARAIFEEMIKLNIPRNEHAYTILMDAYRRVHNHEAVWQIWNSLRKDTLSETLSLSEWFESHVSRSIPKDSLRPSPSETLMETMETIKTPSLKPFSTSLLTTFNVPYSSTTIAKLPCHAVSIMIDALTVEKRFDIIQQEWDQLVKERFEFDSHNWNHYVQSLITFGKIKDACHIIDKYLISGWYQQMEIWRRFDRLRSPQDVREQKRLLSLIDKFPHQKTLLMLAEAFEEMKEKNWLVARQTQSAASLLLDEMEGEFPDVMLAAKEMARSVKWQRKRDESKYTNKGYW